MLAPGTPVDSLKESWDMIKMQFLAEYIDKDLLLIILLRMYLRGSDTTQNRQKCAVATKVYNVHERCYVQCLSSYIPEWCYVLELIAIESGRLPGKMLCQRRGQSIRAKKVISVRHVTICGKNVKID